ncbi:hypothetical protein [Sporosarcina sp. JAI121]|uniref:hypothetical protein n=1 Tax=Sporosarcina sp. JAI121 TaxID=2723064 RepID=UPI0015C85D76|nr:hypothetical protein [Sporosarcina sp. JAI121]NYF25014.1 hypothetical protein [Sporosarcina sp. JAI121]
MKFGKRYSKVTVFMAMLHGVLIGVAAVAVIGLLLAGSKGKDNDDKTEKETATSGPAPVETTAPASEKPLQLFAKQHGAFSSAESATLFIAEDPSLTKAAVIHGNDKFYVWTAVGLAENEVVTNAAEGTYLKAFKVETSACGAIGAGKLDEVLAQTEMAKIKNLIEGKEDAKTKEFHKKIAAITAYSKDLQVVRLHLLSHYSQKDKCIKITF